MKFSQRRADPAVIVTPEEALDAQTAPAFEQVLMQNLADNPARLIIDLGVLRFIDSSGIGAIVRVHRAARDRNVVVIIAAASDRVKMVFRLINLHKVLNMVDTVAAAEAFTPPQA